MIRVISPRAAVKNAGWTTRPPWAREQGSTLIEVVIASLILGIAVAGVALMLSTARSFTVAQGDDRVAFYLAQDKLENLRALGFAAVPTSSGPCPGTTCYNEPGLTAGEDQDQTFLRVTTVICVAKSNVNTAIACPSPQVLKRITVTVTPSMRQADSMVMTTVLACQQC
jgi:Tfp pilus assembly protein PilV